MIVVDFNLPRLNRLSSSYVHIYIEQESEGNRVHRGIIPSLPIPEHERNKKRRQLSPA